MHDYSHKADLEKLPQLNFRVPRDTKPGALAINLLMYLVLVGFQLGAPK